MKIVITGALGHIGSSMIRALPNAFPDAELILIDNLSTQRFSSLFNLPQSGSYRFIQEDLKDLNLIELFNGVEYVIHLAAITDAAGSFDKAELVENNNFISTQIVSEACLKSQAKLIAISSTSVYGTKSTMVDEDCSKLELNPQSPYATTKLREEDYILTLCKDSSLNATVCRFGTIFGISPGMRFHTAVNKFCWQAAYQMPITVWRTAYKQLRPYLGLDDACNAMIHIIKKDLFNGEIYNVLTKNATVSEIIESIRTYQENIVVNFVDSPIMNQLSYEVLGDKFKRTGFNPISDLDCEIKKTLELLRINNSNINN